MTEFNEEDFTAGIEDEIEADFEAIEADIEDFGMEVEDDLLNIEDFDGSDFEPDDE